MNLQAMLPVLLFLAGGGFNEFTYAIDKLRGKGGGGVTPGGPMGLPQILQMLSGGLSQGQGGAPQGQQVGQAAMAAQGQPGAPQGQPQPGQPNAAAMQQLGPNPLQALAMLQLKSRMAMEQQGGMR